MTEEFYGFYSFFIEQNGYDMIFYRDLKTNPCPKRLK